jgi:membrane complex biogenesis BtpA family protein
MSTPPRLVGVLHLPALPSSPGYAGNLGETLDIASREAHALAAAGFDAAIVENFGDTPFAPGRVHPATVAAMTRCAAAVRDAAPALIVGINVLRNDAEAALAVAAATGAAMIRINVHIGARVTDQGIIEGRAHDTLRARLALGLHQVALWCDVDVKHSAALSPRPLAEEAAELCERARADAVLVTGAATGSAAAIDDIATVLAAVAAPVFIASGATAGNIGALMKITAEDRRPHGVIVGSTLRANGRAGAPLDSERARRFAEAFRRAIE